MSFSSSTWQKNNVQRGTFQFLSVREIPTVWFVVWKGRNSENKLIDCQTGWILHSCPHAYRVVIQASLVWTSSPHCCGAMSDLQSSKGMELLVEWDFSEASGHVGAIDPLVSLLFSFCIWVLLLWLFFYEFACNTSISNAITQKSDKSLLQED